MSTWTDATRRTGNRPREIPVWEGRDRIVSQEVRIVGPDGEKVDVMTFRGSFERDVKEFAEAEPRVPRSGRRRKTTTRSRRSCNERFYHRPEMFYSPDKLVISYGVPAPTPAFVYNAVGKSPLPTKDEVSPTRWIPSPPVSICATTTRNG